MTLSKQYKQQLKSRAHPLNPVVSIGIHGFTESVKKELEQTLNDHELIKIRIQENDRTVRQSLYTEVCKATAAEPIQLIGKIGVIYRKKSEKMK